MKMERMMKPAFSVIGMEGSTEDGEDFIARLWETANTRFGEVASLAKREADGSLAGIWGAMSDCSRSFRPWENGFTKGLYLAGVECVGDAVPPEGWTKWVVPGFEYIRVENEGPETFGCALAWLDAEGLALAGAVHDYTCPATGKGYQLFPIRRLED